MISDYTVIGVVLIICGLLAVIACLSYWVYQLRRENDALTRTSEKQRDYINTRWWAKPVTKRQSHIDTETRVMTQREIADLQEPEEPATRLRRRPKPRQS